jgi:hypothetical protein
MTTLGRQLIALGAIAIVGSVGVVLQDTGGKVVTHSEPEKGVRIRFNCSGVTWSLVMGATPSPIDTEQYDEILTREEVRKTANLFCLVNRGSPLATNVKLFSTLEADMPVQRYR